MTLELRPHVANDSIQPNGAVDSTQVETADRVLRVHVLVTSFA